ncbi:MAG TPA: hypothetical protein PK177_00440 [Burkholderiaceae bacterium]|nr:hypothetical protein [Burkholderiaceae bacterium]
MGHRTKSGRHAIAIFELRCDPAPSPRAPWPRVATEPKNQLDDDSSDDDHDRFAGWMSADEIIDELMLELDDEDFWQMPLPPSSVRH